MRDAVADVLHEREGIGRRTSPLGIVASVLLHFIVFVLLVVGARLTPAEPLRPVINMRLAGSSGARAAVAKPSPAPVAPPSIPIPSPEVKPQPETKKDQPVVRPSEKSIWGKSTEKPKEGKPKPATPAPVTPSAAATSTAQSGGSPFAVPGIGKAGVTQLEGGDFPYSIYIDRMLLIVGQHWFRPQTSADTLATVYFVIQRDGTVASPKVEKSSGSSVFDRAALRSVIEASPLPPLPFGYEGTELGVHLTFH